MTIRSYRDRLNDRLQAPPVRTLNVDSVLTHFALITYALPKERLLPFIPQERFEIPEFLINGKPMALMSAVPFLDDDFRFPYLLPFQKFTFAQTNFRVYVIDKQSGEHTVWFFGTTLGSYYVNIARTLWRIPWHYAAYDLDCRYHAEQRRYERYEMRVRSAWCEAEIDLTDTGEAVKGHEGFESYDAMKFILTHPVTGYYHRLDGRLGSYSVWHEELSITTGAARALYFSLYERLGLLSKAEMQQPVSVFLCPQILFRVLLPPVRLT